MTRRVRFVCTDFFSTDELRNIETEIGKLLVEGWSLHSWQSLAHGVTALLTHMEEEIARDQ